MAKQDDEYVSSWVKKLPEPLQDESHKWSSAKRRVMRRWYKEQKRQEDEERKKGNQDTVRISDDESHPYRSTKMPQAKTEPLASDINGAYAIPKWFVRSISVIATVAIPWAFWNTVQLQVMTNEAERTQSSTAVLVELVNRHLTDHTIHRAALAPLEKGIENLEEDIERLQVRMTELERGN